MDVTSDRLTNLDALTRMRALTEVSLGGKTDEDTNVLVGLKAAFAEIFLRPTPKIELVDAAVERGWSIGASERMLRAAWEKTGRPYPYDWAGIVTIVLDRGRIEIDPDHLDPSYIADRSDLPGALSGYAAEQALIERVRTTWGQAFAGSLEGDSENDMLVIRCPDERAARIVAEEAAVLFAEG